MKVLLFTFLCISSFGQQYKPAFVDPCKMATASVYVINLTANTQIITGTSSKQTYICSINIVVGAATNVAIVEGTGTVCATSITGMAEVVQQLQAGILLLMADLL